ncbi:hypothetical protein LINPERHAP1_LOCUS31641 [Linum perenne]
MCDGGDRFRLGQLHQHGRVRSTLLIVVLVLEPQRSFERRLICTTRTRTG